MLIERIRSDKGLMGPTHALSAVAFSLLVTWLASDFMFETVLKSRDTIVFIAAIIIIVGSALMPDLDAVKSTSINVLGVAGSILSTGMRAFSSLIQGIIKGPSDKSSDPHRGFWHTLVAAFLVGLLVKALTSINTVLFSFRGKDISISTLIVLFIIYMSIKLVLASLFKSFYNKNKSPSGQLGMSIGSFIVSVLLVFMLASNTDYSWVAGAVVFGWIAHIFGDMLTVAGVPVLFPLKIRGKRWWDLRFPLGIKAGGTIEMGVIIPLFMIIIIVSLWNIIPLFF